jgi:hypothetical protein
MIDTAADHLSFYRFIDSAVPIILFLWGNRLLARKENRKEQQEQAAKELEERRKLQKIQDDRHLENSKKIDELLQERDWLEAHDHGDQREGPLLAEDIRRRPKRI